MGSWVGVGDNAAAARNYLGLRQRLESPHRWLICRTVVSYVFRAESTRKNRNEYTKKKTAAAAEGFNPMYSCVPQYKLQGFIFNTEWTAEKYNMIQKVV